MEKYFNFKFIIIGIIVAVLLLSLGCTISSPPVKSITSGPSQNVYYDPSKNYAAFLVLNSEVGKNALERMKQHSIDEKYEIGPVEFYDPGNKDFESMLRRLTANRQVQLVWIISSVWDISEIKTAMKNVEYKGSYRYAPSSDQTGQIKIQQ
jgi:hypothetical protein